MRCGSNVYSRSPVPGGGREGQRCMTRVSMRAAVIAAGAGALARAPNPAHNLCPIFAVYR